MSDTSQTLDRGLAVLELVDQAGESVGVREIARQLELGTSIVQRLINTLESRGYVEQIAETHRYRIGHKSVVLGRSSRHSDSLTRAAQAELQVLAADHGLNGYLGALRENGAVYIAVVPSRSRIVLRVDVGETFALHSTALGKILLAAAGDAKARELLGPDPLPKLTEHTIVSPSEVVAQLQQVRDAGYAIVNEENLPGIVSVGAPVRNAQGTIIAGVSVAFAAGTTSLAIETAADLITRAAGRISQVLGCPQSMSDNWTAQ